MGTTSTGLRYPEITDPAYNGADAIKNLALDVTGKYEPPMVPGAAFYPDAAAVPAGTQIKVTGGKINVTTDTAGQAVLTMPGAAGWAAMLTVIVLPAVTIGASNDTLLQAAARNGNSFYLYAWRAGVKLASTALGVNYIAYGY